MKYNDPAKVQRAFSSDGEDLGTGTDDEGATDSYVLLISSSYSRTCLLMYLAYCCTSTACLLSTIFDRRRSRSRSRFFAVMIGIDVVSCVGEEEEEVK